MVHTRVQRPISSPEGLQEHQKLIGLISRKMWLKAVGNYAIWFVGVSNLVWFFDNVLWRELPVS